MVKYIHIGFPKNFSTSLQRDYFSVHPEIYHLGIGLGHNLGYKDSIVEKAFEVYLKTAKHYFYKEKEDHLIQHFSSLWNIKHDKCKAIGVSSEHLSFAFSYDGISAQEKAERLLKLFGAETKIIMIVRNQVDLIKSLYRECVRVGFIGDFKLFIDLLYKYQDRNFVYDFRYDLIYKTYTSLFGSENVGVFFFEDYRDDKGNMIIDDEEIRLFKDLNAFLNLSSHKPNLEHFNESIASDKILIKAEFNKAQRHDLGNHLLESAEKHRIKVYLEEDLEYFEEEKATYSDVLIKRQLIKQLEGIKKEQPLNYTANSERFSKLKTFYHEGNTAFEELLKRKLPDAYYKFQE